MIANNIEELFIEVFKNNLKKMQEPFLLRHY